MSGEQRGDQAAREARRMELDKQWKEGNRKLAGIVHTYLPEHALESLVTYFDSLTAEGQEDLLPLLEKIYLCYHETDRTRDEEPLPAGGPGGEVEGEG